MEIAYSKMMQDFLSYSEPLIDQVDELSQEDAVNLYARIGILAKHATTNITEIDPELRVRLCDGQDKVLERIIDTNVQGYVDIYGVYTPAIHIYRRWVNEELMKDKGLMGYMLAKELHAHPVMMFGTNAAEYPYVELLAELEVLYTTAQPGTPDVYFEHLCNEYPKMDILILHAMYAQTMEYLEVYRKLRADGKVYCGLDMNSYWMGKTSWDSVQAVQFAKQCDIIATSCRSLRDTLNRRPDVHFPCRWMPNGFFNPTNIPIQADADSKKDIILTVGRIGSSQKNNGELLLAFAQVCDILTEWQLHLVGAIEPNFEPVIARYFQAFPQLKGRVIFTGAIADKTELNKEYAQAKLFALTSKMEGGAPNVYAEALFHGCMFVTSDIDAADDITNFGALGEKYKLGDIDALADALLKLATKSRKADFQEHIPKALAYAHKYYDWNRNAKKLAYMLHN